MLKLTFLRIIPLFLLMSHSQCNFAKALSIHLNAFQYSAEYTDEESHLQYLQARYYYPTILRFVQRDSYRLLNRYSYVDGNPVAYKDPSGHCLDCGDSTHIFHASFDKFVVIEEEDEVMSLFYRFNLGLALQDEEENRATDLFKNVLFGPLPSEESVLAATPKKSPSSTHELVKPDIEDSVTDRFHEETDSFKKQKEVVLDSESSRSGKSSSSKEIIAKSRQSSIIQVKAPEALDSDEQRYANELNELDRQNDSEVEDDIFASSNKENVPPNHRQARKFEIPELDLTKLDKPQKTVAELLYEDSSDEGAD